MVISTEVIVLCVLFLLIGLWLGKKICGSPIKVEFSVSMFEVFFCSVMIFLVMTVVIILELWLSWEGKDFVSRTCEFEIVSQLLEAGILYVILVPITSRIFGRWIQFYNIDLCYSYDVSVFNTWYSIAVICNCIWLYIWKENLYFEEDLDAYITLGIIMWLFTIASTWFGVGTGCKGRVYEDIKNTEKSLEEELDIRKERKHLVSCGAAFVVGNVVLYYAISDMNVWEFRWIPCFVSMYVGTLIWILIYNCYYYPSTKRSNRSLAKAIKKIKSGTIKQVDKRYQTVEYSLVNDNSCKRIIIHEKKIDCAKEAEKIKRHFTNIVKNLEKFDYDECKQILSNTVEERSDAIRHGRKLCEDERIKRLKEIR